MAIEEISYTIPNDGQGHLGSQVDLFVSYDPTKPNADGSFQAMGATGTYNTLAADGSVVDHDHIRGLIAVGTGQLGGDNELFVGTTPYVDGNGITFKINNSADSNDGTGAVNFYSDAGTSPPAYFEANFNQQGTVDVTESAACYCSGTLIATDRGEVAVERLAVGDVVVTAAGVRRPVKWIGRRRVNCRLHPRPETVWPYRVQAGAFDPGLPHADLWLSPDHCIAVRVKDDVLVAVRTLENGCTVAQVARDEVTYWHVELDSHDVILANGLPAESYLESGNRHAFDNGGSAASLHPRFEPASRQGYCLPTVGEGVLVTMVRQRLLFQAAVLGWTSAEQDADVHLLADGAVIRPEHDGDRLRFQVPAGIKSLILRSLSSVPRHHVAEAETDRRRLGIAIRDLTITGCEGAAQEIALDDPGLRSGFHPVERQGSTAYRWTSGEARLAADLWADHQDGFTLDLLPMGRSVKLWAARERTRTTAAA